MSLPTFINPLLLAAKHISRPDMRLMMVVMVSTRNRKLRSEFEAELAFLGVRSQTVVVIVMVVVMV
jgi:hypothetical protein